MSGLKIDDWNDWSMVETRSRTFPFYRRSSPQALLLIRTCNIPRAMAYRFPCAYRSQCSHVHSKTSGLCRTEHLHILHSRQLGAADEKPGCRDSAVNLGSVAQTVVFRICLKQARGPFSWDCAVLLQAEPPSSPWCVIDRLVVWTCVRCCSRCLGLTSARHDEVTNGAASNWRIPGKDFAWDTVAFQE